MTTHIVRTYLYWPLYYIANNQCFISTPLISSYFNQVTHGSPLYCRSNQSILSSSCVDIFCCCVGAIPLRFISIQTIYSSCQSRRITTVSITYSFCLHFTHDTSFRLYVYLWQHVLSYRSVCLSPSIADIYRMPRSAHLISIELIACASVVYMRMCMSCLWHKQPIHIRIRAWPETMRI